MLYLLLCGSETLSSPTLLASTHPRIFQPRSADQKESQNLIESQNSGDFAGVFVATLIHGSVSKPCTPVVHIKIAGIYGCSSH